jgi:hypothetical protein
MITVESEFELHVKEQFVKRITPLSGKVLYCTASVNPAETSGHEEGAIWPEILKADGLCGEEAAIVLAWKQSDNDQGRPVIRCQAHADQLVMLGGFSDNDYFLPYCFSIWLEKDGRLTAEQVAQL